MSVSDRQTLIGIVVGPNPADMKAFVAAAAAMDAAPVLFCADYETDVPPIVDDVPVGRIGEGEIFGAMAALTQADRSATVRAKTSCSVVKVQRAKGGNMFDM